mmetsp:Transcript_42884/g.84930  ORF Transcript_42884/g.84930 Transcript_42884/m.84930 type:complete len:372 (-) Transcript_42884:134-1249(-)
MVVFLTAVALVSFGVMMIVALGLHTYGEDAVADWPQNVALVQKGSLLQKGGYPAFVEGMEGAVKFSYAKVQQTQFSYAQKDFMDYSSDCTVVRSKGDEIIDSMRLAKNNVGDNLKLACAIYTYNGNRRQLAETYHTWGKSCSHFLAYSDEEWLIPNSSGVKTIPLRQGLATYEDIWQSVQLIWTDLANKLATHTLDFDYVTFSGDDALFIVPNLRAYLAGLPPLTKDNVLQTGHEFEPTAFEIIGGIDESVVNSGFPWVGGAGYVVNREAIAARLLSKCDPELRQRRASEEDWLTSECLFAAGVFPRDTRDDEGNPRFCPRGPGQSCNESPDVSPSKDAVLFHYLEGQRRQTVVDRLYGCRSSDRQPVRTA